MRPAFPYPGVVALSLLACSALPSMALAAVPVLSVVTPVPQETASPTPGFTFKSSAAGTIQYAGDCSSAKKSAVAGNNTVTFNLLRSGAHFNCQVRVKDAANNLSLPLSVPGFTVAYDSAAKLTITTKEDYNSDGIIDARSETLYDMNGKVIKDSIGKGATGTLKVVEQNTYDTRGNILARKIDANSDGVFEEVFRTVNTYDSAGNLVKKANSVTANGKTVQVNVIDFTYNSKRMLATDKLTYKTSTTTVANTSRYIYDSSYRLSSKKTDFFSEGLYEMTTTYTYNSSGRLSKLNVSSITGQNQATATFTYTTANNIQKIQLTTLPASEDEMSVVFNYDANNVFKSYSMDNDHDGVYEEKGTVTLAGDARLTAMIQQQLVEMDHQ